MSAAAPVGAPARGPAALAAARVRGVPVIVLGAIAAAWAAAIAAQASGAAGVVHHDTVLADGPPPAAAVLLFLAGWQVMMAAMMLPSSLPLVRIFAAASATAPNRGRALAAFLGAYALVWTSFGMLAFAGDAGLHALVNASPWVEEHEWAIAPSVLMLAGAFQFTPLKDALPALLPPPRLLHAPSLQARNNCRVQARSPPRGLLRGLLLGADARDVRRRRGKPDLDGAPYRADGAREDPPPGRPHSAADRRDPAGAGLDTVPLGSIDLALAPGEIRPLDFGIPRCRRVPFEPSGSRSHKAARANWSTVSGDSRTPCASARLVCTAGRACSGRRPAVRSRRALLLHCARNAAVGSRRAVAQHGKPSASRRRSRRPPLDQQASGGYVPQKVRYEPQLAGAGAAYDSRPERSSNGWAKTWSRR